MSFTFPSAALSQHIAVLGKTGSGKTSTAKLVIEQVVHEGARVCILDPIKSDWWGLTSSVDGRRAGLPFYILGGPRGHVPLHSAAGKSIAEIVANASLRLSIIDMADFEPGGQARFFVDFAPTLLRKMRGVVYLVIEEAHQFAPKERSGIGAENMSIHWAKTLATAGRVKGLRLMVITQRTQSLHNALLGSCDTIVAHRMTAPADQGPVINWLKANTNKETTTKVAESLSSLKTGQGWLCSCEAKIFELVSFPRIKTYDNTTTPTGDGEERHIRTAQVDEDSLRALIGDAVKEAEDNDPKLLRKKIAELEKKLASAKPEVQIKTERVEVPTFLKMQETIAKLDQMLDPVDGIRLRVESLRDYLKNAVFHDEVDKRFSKPAIDSGRRPSYKPQKLNGDASTLPIGEQAILRACIQYPSGLHRRQLTVLTGYKRSTRDAYISRLREKNYVSVSGDSIVATEDGIAAIPDAEPLPRGEELQQFWLATLPIGEREILKVLIAAHPESVRRDELESSTGFKRSTRDAYISRLASKELVIDCGRGEVRATDNLF